MKTSSKQSLEEEVPDSRPDIIHKVAAEFVGTFVLVFIGVGSGFIDQRIKISLLGVALVAGGVLTAMIYTLGHISGAHFNPAVTVGFAVARQFLWKHVAWYVIAQVLGAMIGSLTLQWLFDVEHAVVMLTLPGGRTSNLNAFACEIIVTFILMFVICGSASDDMAVKELAGVAIGATLAFDIIIAGTISGASMNPARSIGPAIATKTFSKLWIYIFAPVIGAAAASTLYNFLRLPAPEKNTMQSKGNGDDVFYNQAYEP